MTPNALRLDLISPSELEADLTDWLTELTPAAPLLVTNVRGHNDASRPMTVAEQVAGTMPLIRLSLTTDEATARRVLESLTTNYANSGVRWSMWPVETGRA